MLLMYLHEPDTVIVDGRYGSLNEERCPTTMADVELGPWVCSSSHMPTYKKEKKL